MKKFLLLIGIVVTFISCEKSPESRADALIKKELMKSLYKPDTYKPIETTIDSAFSPKDDPAFFEKIQDLVRIAKDIESCQYDQKHAKSSMSLWSGPYQSAFGRNQYDEAKEDYDKATKNLEKATEKAQKMGLEMYSMLNKKPIFIGWKATHNYRAENNAGNTSIGNSVYIIDENFQKILFSCEEDEYKEIQKGIDVFKEQMEEVE